MTYSSYTKEDIFDVDRDNYKKICEIFMSMAQDEETKRQIQGILFDGGFDDFSTSIEKMSHSNPILEAKKRIAYANLLITHPETFKLIKDNNITVFHGTNFNALPNIIKNGMKCVDALTEAGFDLKTGEQWSRIQEKRDFISFTNDIDIATEYGMIGIDKYVFQVVIGLSSESLKKQRKCIVNSDLPEVGILDSIPREDIKFIGVPPDRVEFVKRIVNDERIIISSLDFEDRFYFMEDYGKILIDSEEVTKMINQKKETDEKGLTKPKNINEKKTFESNDINELAKSRTLQGILDSYNKIKNFFVEKFKNIKNKLKGKKENGDKEKNE